MCVLKSYQGNSRIYGAHQVEKKCSAHTWPRKQWIPNTVVEWPQQAYNFIPGMSMNKDQGLPDLAQFPTV